MVGFLVSLYTKIAKGDLMMDIEFMGKIRLCYATSLTGVLIALSRLAALALPVFAVVREFSTLPEWIVFSNKMSGAPFAVAALIAKVAMLIERPGDYAKFLATVPALCFDALVVWAIFARQVLCSPLSHAKVIAKVVISSFQQATFANEILPALGAFDFGAVVMDRILAGVKPLVASASAWAATVVFLIFFCCACFAREVFTAFVADQIDAVGWSWANIAALLAFPRESILGTFASPIIFGRGRLPFVAPVAALEPRANLLGWVALVSNRLLSFSDASFAIRCQTIGAGVSDLEIFCRFRELRSAGSALLMRYIWGRLILHVESPFDLPRPRVLEHRWDNCFPALIIPQGAGK